MLEAIHIGSVVTATVGACCAVGDARDRSAVVWFPELVMVAAMLDVITGVGLVAPMVWAALLVGMALWMAIDIRMLRNAVTTARHRHTDSLRGGMTVLRGASLVVMALLMLVMSAHSGMASTTSGLTNSGHAAHAGGTAVLQQFVVLCVAGVLGLAAWVVTRLVREAKASSATHDARVYLRFLGPLEVISMASSLTLMTMATIS